MDAVFGTHLPVFAALFILMLAGAAFMTGQAVAAAWRPLWYVFLYCFMLGLFDRFLAWSLFQRELLSLTGFVVDTAMLTVIALFAHRIMHVRRMVTQYPWQYERAGLWGYREKASPDEPRSRRRE